MRGPIDGVPPLLMPAAHALQQAHEDVREVLGRLTTDQLWVRPGGAASVGFHVRHIGGALDRLFTYARGESLDAAQLRAKVNEEQDTGLDASALAAEVDDAMLRAFTQLRATTHEMLLEPRGVGRRQLPSNVLGLLFHAAEHATRHAGQAITTAKVVLDSQLPTPTFTTPNA